MELEVLNDVVVKQEYQVRVINGFAVLKKFRHRYRYQWVLSKYYAECPKFQPK
jgi:hypothetical protein